MEWLLWLVGVLSLYFLLFYTPLPKDMAHRELMHFFDFGSKIVNQGGHLVEAVFGQRARIKYLRFLLYVCSLVSQPPVIGVQRSWTLLGGVRTRVWRPKPRGHGIDKPLDTTPVVFLHGGGWAAIRPHYYDDPMSRLAKRLGCTIFGVDYRLSPEHPYPAGLDDCLAAIEALDEKRCAEYGLSSEGIVILGDSAGGNLTAAVSRTLVGRRHVKCQILLYPVTTVFGFSFRSFADFGCKEIGAQILAPEIVARKILLYLGLDASRGSVRKLLRSQHIVKGTSSVHDELVREYGAIVETRDEGGPDERLCAQFAKFALDPTISPLLDPDPSGLPPTMVCTCGFDVLRDEGRAYAKRLAAFGVPVEDAYYPRAFHGILNFPFSPVARRMQHDIAKFILKHAAD